MKNRFQHIAAKASRLWRKVEGLVLFIGVPVGVMVWLYSNFATASGLKDARDDVQAAKKELHEYVDQRHAEVSGRLDAIREEQKAQRQLAEKILLRVSR